MVALVTALLAPLFINWSDYKGRFEAEASQLLGQPVRVAGQTSARLLPFPSVTFNDIEVGPPEAPLLRADGFSMDVELTPFMTGEILIFDMRIVRPRITVTLDETGAPIWPLPAQRLIDPAQISLENAAITDGTVTVIDPTEERTMVARNLDLTVSADGLFGPWRAVGTADLGETAVGFSASTGQFSSQGFSLQLGLEVADFLVRIQSDGRIAADAQSGQLVYAGGFRLRPHLIEQAYAVEGDFTATARGLDVADFRASFGDPADPYIVQGSAALNGGAAPGYRIEARGNQINVGRYAAEADQTADDNGGQAGLSLRDRMAAIHDFVAAMPVPPMAGTISLDLPAILVGDATIRDVRLEARPDVGADKRNWRFDRIEAQFPGRTLVEADGVLRLPAAGRGIEETVFDGRTIIASRQPTGLARWLDVEATEAVRQLGGAGFSARVTLSANRQAAEDVEIIADRARLTGRIARRSASGAARPYLSVALSGQRLDGSSLQALGAITGAGEGGVLLDSHDVDLALDLNDVIAMQTQIGRLDTVVRARGARVEIDRFVASDVYGATITGTGSLVRRDDGEISTAFDLGVIAANATPLAQALAERMPHNGVLAHLSAVTGQRPVIAEQAQLAFIGQARFAADGALTEVTADLSGAAAGANLSGNMAGTGLVRGDEPFELALALDEIDPATIMALGGLPVLSVDGSGLGLPVPAQLTFGLNRRATGESVDLQLDIQAVSDRVSFEGRVMAAGQEPRFEGQLNGSTIDAEPYLTALGLILPGMGLGAPTDLSTRLVRSGNVWQLDSFEAMIADSAVTGSAHFANDALLGRTVRGTVTAQAVDAGLLAALYTGQLDWPAADTRFDAPLHDGTRVQVTVSADQLYLGPWTFDDASADLDINGNLLTVTDFAATGLDGTAHAGGVRLQNDRGQINAAGQVALKGLPAATAIDGAQGRIDGLFDLDLSLTGSGTTGSELLRSLTGTGVVSGQDIEIDLFNAAAMTTIVPAADAIGFEITPAQIAQIARSALFSRMTRFDDFAAPVAVSDGVMQAANLSLSPRQSETVVSGALRYDLVARTSEGMFDVRLDPGGQTVPGMSADVSLTLGPDASGALDVQADWTGLIAFVTQRALEIEQARIERLQSRLLERQRLRRQIRYARFVRTEQLVRDDEERRRIQGQERRERIRLQELIPAPAPEPAETAAPVSAPALDAPVAPAPLAPTDLDAGVPMSPPATLEDDQVVRMPLAPIAPAPADPAPAPQTIAPGRPSPSIDFSPDTIETIIQSVPGGGFQ